MLRGTPLIVGDGTIPGVKIPEKLKKLIPIIVQKCQDFGLDFFPPIIEKLTYDEMSEVAAYGGMPVRYPHYRFGMEFEQLSKRYEYGLGKIFEMVINNSPCYIYCLDSNSILEDVLVICHAIGHSHFFKNNVFFGQTNRDMLNVMANHGSRIRKYMSRWGKYNVLDFIDSVLAIDTLIDPSSAWDKRVIPDYVTEDKREYQFPKRLYPSHNYMDSWVNTPEYLKKEKERIKKEEVAEYLGLFQGEEKDILRFLRDCAPLKPWQQDIIAMLYDEAIYFAPQRMTKVANEGFACVTSKTLLYTDKGILRAKDIVNNKLDVNIHDSEKEQKVTNWFIHKNKKTVKLVTRRGLELEGSETHRIVDAFGNWKKLKDFSVGDKVKINPGTDLWADEYFQYKKKLFDEQWAENFVDCCDTLADCDFRWFTEVIFQSPKSVVVAFLRKMFNKFGTIQDSVIEYEDKTNEGAKELQCLLLNIGVVGSRKENIISISNTNLFLFKNRIGFIDNEKQQQLAKITQCIFDSPFDGNIAYPDNRVDEIVEISYGQDDVYDISVENTHKYVAQGFINHNSYTDYKMLACEGLCSLGQDSSDQGIIEYALHKTAVLGPERSLNPYRLGYTILLDIEERWNKGKFGDEWEKCNTYKEKEDWDKNLGLGKQKVFEVCKHYDDLTLLMEFFTPELCSKMEFFEWKQYGHEDKIEGRNFKNIKKQLVRRHINGGLPDIRLVDPNYKNKRWFLMEHFWDGRILEEQFVPPTMCAIFAIWQNPVVLTSKNINGDEIIYFCGGKDEHDVVKYTREKFETALLQ